MSQQTLIVALHVGVILACLGYLGWAFWQVLDCVRTGEIFHAKAFGFTCFLAFVIATADVVILTS